MMSASAPQGSHNKYNREINNSYTTLI